VDKRTATKPRCYLRRYSSYAKECRVCPFARRCRYYSDKSAPPDQSEEAQAILKTLSKGPKSRDQLTRAAKKTLPSDVPDYRVKKALSNLRRFEMIALRQNGNIWLYHLNRSEK
jgi:hypothetical protein